MKTNLIFNIACCFIFFNRAFAQIIFQKIFAGICDTVQITTDEGNLVDGRNFENSKVSARKNYSSIARTSNLKLETKTFSDGIYFCQIKTNEKIFNQKFIIHH